MCVDFRDLYTLMSLLHGNYGAARWGEGCLNREKAKYFRDFWGLPEKEVAIIFLEGERSIPGRH